MGEPASISIDVDGVWCYRAIHGLASTDTDHDPIYQDALPRFKALLDEFDIKATLFVVGRDVDTSEERANILSQFAADGHEIASHSYSHDYRLSQLPPDQIVDDLNRAQDIIEGATGSRPVGFRAPGYNMSASLSAAIDSAGLSYSSSIFPCPAYFAARAAAIARYAIVRKPSRSLRGDPREFFATRSLYTPSANALHRPAKDGEPRRKYIEVPISTPRLFPWIGTSIVLFPPAVVKRATQAVLKRSAPAVLELHAIDFASAEDKGYEVDIIEAQPDLRVPIEKKLRRLREVFKALSSSRRICTLRELTMGRASSQD